MLSIKTTDAVVEKKIEIMINEFFATDESDDQIMMVPLLLVQ
jgi:hypothetical protein